MSTNETPQQSDTNGKPSLATKAKVAGKWLLTIAVGRVIGKLLDLFL